MEDQKRGSEGNKRIVSSLKENSPVSGNITMMIMGDIGKIRSFTISRHILLWSSIFLSLYIVLSLFIIILFIDIRFRFQAQSERLEELQDKYTGLQKNLLKSQQRTANLEAYIESTSKQKTAGSTVSVEVPGVPSGERTIIKTDEKGSEQTTKSLDIEEPEIRRLDSGIEIDFRLVNVTSGVGAIEGYMHIIVSDKNNNFPPVWNVSSRGIQNGLPSEYRSAERFIIQRFKQYHREFTSDSSFGTPANIRILAYDTSGSLILMKEYEVKDTF